MALIINFHGMAEEKQGVACKNEEDSSIVSYEKIKELLEASPIYARYLQLVVCKGRNNGVADIFAQYIKCSDNEDGYFECMYAFDDTLHIHNEKLYHAEENSLYMDNDAIVPYCYYGMVASSSMLEESQNSEGWYKYISTSQSIDMYPKDTYVEGTYGDADKNDMPYIYVLKLQDEQGDDFFHNDPLYQMLRHDSALLHSS